MITSILIALSVVYILSCIAQFWFIRKYADHGLFVDEMNWLDYLVIFTPIINTIMYIALVLTNEADLTDPQDIEEDTNNNVGVNKITTEYNKYLERDDKF